MSIKIYGVPIHLEYLDNLFEAVSAYSLNA